MKCYLTNECARKMKYYVDATESEISGYGKSEFRDGDIYITDVVIMKQRCTGASTNLAELGEGSQADFLMELIKRGENAIHWNVWWHSHANMGVFWSQTDNQNIAEQSNNGGYLVSLVTNKQGKYKTRFDIYPKDVSPLKMHTYFKAQDDIPTSILPEQSNPERLKELDILLSTKVAIVNQEIDKIEINAKDAIAKLQLKIDEIVTKKNNILKVLNDKYEAETQAEYDEYESLSNDCIKEDKVLEMQIKQEVKDKVEVPSVYIPVSKTYWLNRETPNNNSLFGNKSKLDEELDKIKEEFGMKGAPSYPTVKKYLSKKERKLAKKERRAQKKQQPKMSEIGFTSPEYEDIPTQTTWDNHERIV